MLCLHGVSAQGRSWLAVARRLADRATFLLPDLIGRGGSDAFPGGSFTLEDEADRIEAIMDALRAHGDVDGAGRAGARLPPVIAGHSQGAALALALAARDPGVVGLLLSNPVTPWTRRPAVLDVLRSGLMRKVVAGMFSPLRGPLATVIIRRAAGPGFRPPRELVRGYAEPYADVRRARTLMALLRDWQPNELAEHIPTERIIARVVTGALDPRIDPRAAERLANEMGGRITVVEDGGHILPEQHPDLLADELGRVFEAVREAGSERH